MTPHLVKQTKHALSNGAAEIERLKRENELLAVKAQALDALCGILALIVPRTGQAYAPDTVWILRSLLADIERAEPAAADPAPTDSPKQEIQSDD